MAYEKQDRHRHRGDEDHRLEGADAAERIRDPARQNPPARIAEGADGDRKGRDGRGHAGVARKRHQLADGHQAGGRPETERDPEAVERARREHLARRDVAARHRRGRGAPVRRAITWRWILQQRGARHRHDEEGGAEQLKRRAPAHARHHLGGERTEDRGARAVSTHHQADDEPTLVGKPLRSDRRRRGVAESVAQADDDAEREIQRDQRARETGEDEAGADEDAANRRADARSLEILDPPGHDERQRETDDRDREDPGCLRAGPAEFLFQREHEHAPGVERSERQVHQDAARDRQPAVGHGVVGGFILCPLTIS